MALSIKYRALVYLIVCGLFLLAACCCSAGAIHQYVFFDTEREGIHDPVFLNTKAFEGAQIKYTWRELEPKKDAYNFSGIRSDLAFLTSKKKKLWIQVQDVTFSPSYKCVPKYILGDPKYHGGANLQYDIEGDDEKKATPAGWVARRWDPAVRKRFQKLLFALGKEFDGKIEGINLPETSVDVGDTGLWWPKGFAPAVYRDAILDNMAALKRAFPKSVAMIYANFMPGEWLPEDNKHYLESVYQRAKELKVAVGGPDTLPYKPGQMKHDYPLIRAVHESIPTGIAVQEGNYAYFNPKTGKQITISEIIGFANDYLGVRYIFWCTQEPYFSKELLPFLNKSPQASDRKPPPATKAESAKPASHL
jgi:hypothetical protein